MRIAMMTNNYKPVVGGVPISVERLSEALRDRGHRVTIFAPHCPGETPEEDVVRYRSADRGLPAGTVVPNPLDPVIRREFRRGGYDLIHMHHPMMIGYTGLYLAHRYDVPAVLTYHTRYEQYLHYWKPYGAMQRRAGAESGVLRAGCRLVQGAMAAHNRFFMNRCGLVLAPTPQMREHLEAAGVASPVQVLPTGLAEGDLEWDAPFSEELRARYLRGRTHLFCTVSRLEEEKNLPFLLRSLAELRARCGDSFRLLLIGDGTQRDALEAQAAALGLADNVEFVGCVPHSMLASYYRACDLFLFASRSETQGIVLLEAMAAGLPVVAVDATGVCDVVDDAVNGWKTPEDAAIFAARVRMLADNPLLWHRMSGEARRTAAGCTAAAVAARAERCYQELLERHRAGDIPVRQRAGEAAPRRRIAH